MKTSARLLADWFGLLKLTYWDHPTSSPGLFPKKMGGAPPIFLGESPGDEVGDKQPLMVWCDLISFPNYSKYIFVTFPRLSQSPFPVYAFDLWQVYTFPFWGVFYECAWRSFDTYSSTHHLLTENVNGPIKWVAAWPCFALAGIVMTGPSGINLGFWGTFHQPLP